MLRKTVLALGLVLSVCSIMLPLAACALQPAIPVIGFLNPASSDTNDYLVAAFRQGLRETGYVEGHNVAIEYRWAEGHYDRLLALATELVQRRVAVIATGGGNTGARAAKAATATIPIVSIGLDDPVRDGLVASLDRPGGNVTGVSFTGGSFSPTAMNVKRLDILHEVVPPAAVIAVLVNPTSVLAETRSRDVQVAARVMGRQVRILNASSEREIDMAFAAVAQMHAGALLITSDPFFSTRRQQLVELAARHAVPTIYEWREATAAGGLMSYGPYLPEAYRQMGIYVGKILKGAKPADLPVMQPAKFDLVINLRTAKALGFRIPPELLMQADDVIE